MAQKGVPGVGYLPGERYQSNLGASSESFAPSVGAQLVRVIQVDSTRGRVQVSNSNGTRWAWIGKTKASGTLAGRISNPNPTDWGVVIPVNGDGKSWVWICSVNVVDPTLNLEEDSNFTTPVELVHRDYEKHETGSFKLLDKLGNFVLSLFKKATNEASVAMKNVTVQVSNAGVVTITHFRGNNLPSVVLTSDQIGTMTIKNMMDDGETIAFSITADKLGTAVFENNDHQMSLVAADGAAIFRYLHKLKGTVIQVTDSGDIAIVDSVGSSIMYDGSDSSISVASAWGSSVYVADQIEITSKKGSSVIVADAMLQLSSVGGQSVVMDDESNQIVVNGGTILLNAGTVALGGTPLQFPLLTQLFAAFFDAHVHGEPGTPPTIPSASIIKTLTTNFTTGG